MRGCWRGFSAVAIAVLFTGMVGTPTRAASSYATPAFQSQWGQGEALAPNFWGPLSTARNGVMEPYQETGGMRLVQYFDKGRMESGQGGKVTNGLLATEIVKGQVQVGDNAFQAKTPPGIAIAGDSDNPGPTYAQLSTRAAVLLANAPNQTDTRISRGVTSSGDITTGNTPNSPGTTLTAYDAPTQHNVTLAFSQYRQSAGLGTIGYAISEPFFATVKVGGTAKDVVIQVFERRVLTYTATNPEAFQVEMGNIGQHYYQWRYSGGTSQIAPVAAVPATTAPTAPTAAPVATAAPASTLAVTFTDVTSPIQRGNVATANVQTAPGANCSIVVTYKSGPSEARGLDPKTAGSNGAVSWSWLVGGNTTPGPWPIKVTCSAGGQSTTASTTFTVTAKS